MTPIKYGGLKYFVRWFSQIDSSTGTELCLGEGNSYHQKGESFSLFDGCYNCSFNESCDLSCHPNPECHDKIGNINWTFVASGGSRISQKGDVIPEGAPTYYFAIFLPKTAWKWRYSDRVSGVMLPLDPPLPSLLPRNAVDKWFKVYESWTCDTVC